MKINRLHIISATVFMSSMIMTGCDSTLDIDTPADKISLDDAYDTPESIEAIHTGLYAKNFLGNNVYHSHIPVYLSFFSDDLKHSNSGTYGVYFSNQYIESTDICGNFWNYEYSSIYRSNSFIDNVTGFNGLSEGTKNFYLASAYSFRALDYFYLTNVYGDVPLVLNSTDINGNATKPRAAQSQVYAQIEADLLKAAALFGEEDHGVTNFSANSCYALLSRVYVYTEQWDKAIEYANKLIPVADGGSGKKYQLEEIEKVYKASSREAIFSANMEGYSGSGTYVGYTREGNMFVPSKNTVTYTLTNCIVDILQNDKRSAWIANNNGIYYPYKYKNRANQTDADNYEYQNWFRLTEMYLCRAEALAHKGDLAGAVADVNKIRRRAGISELDAQLMTQEDVLDAILEERHKEFFCEMGHRFFDLRRTGKMAEVYSRLDWKQPWEQYRQYLPISETELYANPNLVQNDEY